MNELKRFKRNSGLFSVILHLIRSNVIVFSYKSSLSQICGIHVWQQKYEPNLKALGIICKEDKGKKGTYTFNENKFFYLIYNSIIQEEKSEVISLLMKYKRRILEKYEPYFLKDKVIHKKCIFSKYKSPIVTELLNKGKIGKNDIAFTAKTKLDVKSEKEAKDINWITRQISGLKREIMTELGMLFRIFAREDILIGIKNSIYDGITQPRKGIKNSYPTLRERVSSVLDELIEYVEESFSIDYLGGDAQGYFIKSFYGALKKGVTNYEELKKELTELWITDSQTKIPVLMALPFIKERLIELQ